MRKNIIYFIVCFISYISVSCSDSTDVDSIGNPKNNTVINSVTLLTANPSKDTEQSIELKWTNPSDSSLHKVEVAYQTKSAIARNTTNPMLVDVVAGQNSSIVFRASYYTTYIISVTAISKTGQRSKTLQVATKPSFSTDDKNASPVLLNRADTLFTSILQKCMGGPRDVWRHYPKPDGYWDGDAVVWSQGGGLSGFTAIREASSKYPKYADKYADMDQRMINSIDKFRVIDSRNGVEGYSVYPASGNERFFDDNVWIGVDMVDLYLLTGDNTILTRADIVWKYLLTGMDEDGGVFWKELPDKSKSKHACATAPTAVMAAKLYLATGKSEYLDYAKKSYAWCINTLQDKSDYLICDLQREDGSIDYAKYTYNSGQAIQGAALLYNITKEAQYLTEAQQIADAMYKKWFSKYYSNVFGKEITMIGGHTWFNAVALRGFIELYKIDGNRKYVTAYEEMLSHAWLSSCRDKNLELLNYDDFMGGKQQTSWDILHLGATVEMIARLASLEAEGL